MKIKTKLRLGFGFLFFLVLLIGGVAAIYLYEVSRTSKLILKDNFNSLSYAIEMQNILNENSLSLSGTAAKELRAELKKQSQNVTEPGEHELTRQIQDGLDSISRKPDNMGLNAGIIQNLHRNIRKIENLNMEAIVRKNNNAQSSVRDATIYLGAFGSLTLMVIFSFIVNFPSFIANPLIELTEGIKEISKKNYQKRLDFPAYNEFGELAFAFNQMATRLNDWENSNVARILSEKLRIETIIEKMEDAILGLDEVQEIIFINPKARKLLNLHDTEIKQLNAKQLAQSNELMRSILDQNNIDKAIKIYSEGKESYFQLESHDILVPQYSPGGDKQTFTTSGEFAGEVYILRNITRFRELDEAKTNFIATISHELKTPISSIQLSLKLLNDERIGNLNAEQLQLLKHIKNDSTRLLKITSELLDLSQAETGNIQLNFIVSAAEDIVGYAVNSVKFQADQKHITLQFICDPNLPSVYADVEKTAWVLVNFLSNAIRYSPQESVIVISVKAAQDMIEFSVKDHGGGIEDKYKERIFDKYFRIPTGDKKNDGTGLGLAISKDFIEAQKGEIFVESTFGTGSRFGFKLPTA
jgi:NtrC-family two-component system sensor histidine kinase KinB